MTHSVTLHLPFKFPFSKNKDFLCNLNSYAGMPSILLSKAKDKFEEKVKDLIDTLPQFSRFELEYTLFYGSNRDVDTNNICSVVDKFFCDILKRRGRIEDDSRHFLTRTTFQFGEVDRINPRVEVQITGTLKEMEPMKIVLDNDELKQAVDDYIATDASLYTRAAQALITKKMILTENQRIDVQVRTHEGQREAICRIVDTTSENPTTTKIAEQGRPSTRLGSAETVMPKTKEAPKESQQSEPKQAAPNEPAKKAAGGLFSASKPAPEPVAPVEPEPVQSEPESVEGEAPEQPEEPFVLQGTMSDPTADLTSETVAQAPTEEPKSPTRSLFSFPNSKT